MKALLDAHALLWFLAGSTKRSAGALAFIQDSRNTLFVSPATLWEIGIKDSLGKLILPQPFDQLFPSRLDACNILLLPILIPHLQLHRHLPFHHNDPFDRLVIAQALSEEMAIISCDSKFLAYGAKLLW
jgi:PIN domain nuclease of toxin-antitoxin system